MKTADPGTRAGVCRHAGTHSLRRGRKAGWPELGEVEGGGGPEREGGGSQACRAFWGRFSILVFIIRTRDTSLKGWEGGLI